MPYTVGSLLHFYILVAPLKSLCSERMFDWEEKIRLQGYTLLQLTSDSPHYEIKDLSKHSVLIATPEKIDSLLRSLEGMRDFISHIHLLMLDEVCSISIFHV